MRLFLCYIKKRHLRDAIILSILGLFSAITSLLMNISLQYSIDYVFGMPNTEVGIAVILFCTMAIGTFLSDQVGEGYILIRKKFLFSRAIRELLINKHHSISYLRAQKKDIGYLMNLDSEVDSATETYALIAYFLPYCVLECICFAVYLTFFVSWKMSVVLILLIPFSLIQNNITEQIKNDNDEYLRKKAESHNFFLNIISKAEFVQANQFCAEVNTRYRKRVSEIYQVQKRLFRKEALLTFVQFVLDKCVTFGIPLIGTFMFFQNIISPGEVAASTMIYSSFLMPSIFQFFEILKEIKASQSSILVTMEELTQADYNCLDKKTRREILDLGVLVKVDRIGFCYDTAPILNELSLVLPQTGTVGISGSSGSGKSTLGKILACLIHPDCGTVEYNARYFANCDIRSEIAYVSASPFFLDESLRTNICSEKVAYGDDKYTADLLKDLPDEKTLLIENASNLSGGQRQILAFVRALAKQNAKLFILDEPTASLDSESRWRFIKIVHELARERCVVIITHQQDVLEKMDHQYKLVNGQLIKIM